MKLIPRYVFQTANRHGCGKHKNPDCLCDVKLNTNNTVTIDRTIPHPFFTVALDELGEDMVTERNIVEVCSVVLGAFDTFRFRESSAHQPVSDSGPAEWQALDEAARLALRDHYRVGSPWSVARLELDCVAARSQPIRDHYNQCRAWHVRSQRSKRYQERQARKRDILCAHCGTLILNADTRRNTCSAGCRMAATRARRRDQYNKKGQP